MFNFLPPDKTMETTPNTRKKILKAFIIFCIIWPRISISGNLH